MRARRLYSGLIVILLLATACARQPVPSPTAPNDKLAEILARGTLVIATDQEYPPFSLLDPTQPRAKDTQCTVAQYTANQFTGFDAMTGVEIARRLGVEPCFVTPQWSQLVAGNWSNVWDLHVGSMTPTQARMEVLYFSQPYFATPIQVFVHAKNLTYQKPADLGGKRIGTCAGCTYENYLQGNLGLPGVQVDYLIENPQIIAYDNEIPAFEDLARGDGLILDAIVTQLSAGQKAIASGLSLRMLPEPLYYAYAAAAIDKKNSRDPIRFRDTISEIILAMHQDGTLSALSLQWLGLDLTREAASFDLERLPQTP